MKTKFPLTLLLSLIFGLCPSQAQVPQGFNYQAIARDAGGAVLPNTPLQVMLYIQSSSSGGTIFWKELHPSVTTNPFGLFSVVVGTGTKQGESTVASFDLIDWSVSPKYLKTEIYYSGSWKDMGTAQLYAVPYAMQAKNSEQWLTNGTDIYRPTGNVGIGISSPSSKLDIDGVLTVRNKIITGSEAIEINQQGTGNRNAYIDFHGDDIQTDYALRLIRYNTGKDANSSLYHRGNGALQLYSADLGPIDLYTNSIQRMRVGVDGNVGIGTTTPVGKLDIRPSSDWADDIPLFEVRNKYGIPILAVYNNGVRILVDHSNSKAVKGGFAVGGYDMTKAGKTVDFMTISPDSIRFNIDNSTAKAVKGGFAVGGYDMTKEGSINQDFMYITPQVSSSGQYNTFLGYQAGHSNQTNGLYNSFVGYHSGYSNLTGVYNVFLGFNSGYSNTSGSSNVFIGNAAGSSNTTGTNNLLLGYQSGYYVNQSSYNVMIGNDAGHWTNYMPPTGDQGSYNTFVGYMSGQTNSTGAYNSFFGYKAGFGKVPEGISGNNNVAVGSNSGFNINSGSNNVFLGTNAGFTNSQGSSNVFIGNEAGYLNEIGFNNIYIGKSAGYNSGTVYCGNCLHYDPGTDSWPAGPVAWGDNNTCLGTEAGRNNKGSYNVFIGNNTGISNTTGEGNVFQGWGAGDQNTAGAYNTYIGTAAGYQATGSGNVFIGSMAGYHETGSDLLYIENKSHSTPLIWGDFAHGLLNFNANVGIGISPTHPIHVSGGAYCSGSTWINSSDKNLKENFEIVDGETILDLIGELPIMKWNYKAESSNIKHIGPVAQDFYSLFSLGNDDKSISSVDPSGIALVAIKELSKENREMKQQIESYKTENNDMKLELQAIQEKVDRIEARLGADDIK